jgi:hypothetical protein
MIASIKLVLSGIFKIRVIFIHNIFKYKRFDYNSGTVGVKNSKG